MVGLNGRTLPDADVNQTVFNGSHAITAAKDGQQRRARSPHPARGPKPLLPRSLKEALQLAELLSKSKLIPKGFETPETCLVGILYGMEVGLSPIAALQRMAVIDGRPTIWGDAALALVQASGLLQSIKEHIVEDKGTQTITAICMVQREGRLEPVIGSFSIDDAKRAGLWQKPGPWTDYPKRMLTMRARAFALRDAFPDVLAGLYIREEFEGIEKRYDRQSSGSIGTPSTQDIIRDDAECELAQVLNQKENSEAVNKISETENGNTRNSASAPIRRAPPPPGLPTKLRDASTEDISHDEVRNEENGLSESNDREPRSGHLDPETLLDLFDSALCCALDPPTLEEIIDEFAARLKSLPPDIQQRAELIINRHQKRVEELDQVMEQPPYDTKEAVSEASHDTETGELASSDKPRGLMRVLPLLGVGRTSSIGRGRKRRESRVRSIASWNARTRLSELNPLISNDGVMTSDPSEDEE